MKNHGTQLTKGKLPVLRGRVVGEVLYVHCPWCDREHVPIRVFMNVLDERRSIGP
jgi:hypothetical protein